MIKSGQYMPQSLEIKAMMQNVNTLKEQQKELFYRIRSDEAINKMPHDTFHQGTLNTLYESQLDYLRHTHQ